MNPSAFAAALTSRCAPVAAPILLARASLSHAPQLAPNHSFRLLRLSHRSRKVLSQAQEEEMTVAEIELPTEEVAENAREALCQLSELVRKHAFEDVLLLAKRDAQQVEVKVPHAAYRLFLEVLAQLSRGNAVTIVPMHHELTTQQAAELLNVSRPHLVHLLEMKTIPYRKVGTHRRVLAADVLAYKRKDDARRKDVASELTRLADDMGTGY
jgi:excisionase family DNA binding protein